MRIYRRLWVGGGVPLFVDGGVGAGGTYCIAAYSAVVLSEFAKCYETDLTLRLLLVVIFID